MARGFRVCKRLFKISVIKHKMKERNIYFNSSGDKNVEVAKEVDHISTPQ